MLENKKRKARAERWRVSLWDDGVGATPLELPERRMWPAGLMLAVMFAIFAGIEQMTIVRMSGHSVRGVSDLMFVLFEGFWVLAWSVGVLILGALTVLFLFYGESARLQDGRLVHVPWLGPLKAIVKYDLARVRNVRVENVGSEDSVCIRFDYGEGSNGLGDTMPRSDAERLVHRSQSATAAAGAVTKTAATAPAREAPRHEPVAVAAQTPDLPPPSLTSPSGLALIAANLVPLVGVLFFNWDLASLMILFWAESAVIGFYTMFKMAIVGHFGGFMAGHFGQRDTKITESARSHRSRCALIH